MEQKKNSRNTKYDAFILLDKTDRALYVAKKLRDRIRNYKTPGNLEKKIGKNQIRDIYIGAETESEGKVPDYNIVQSLKNSDWLIIICSPKLKESKWCNELINQFIAEHGKDRILAVLAKGEPSDSFPAALFYRDKSIIDASGREQIIKEKVEPLAADFRGNSKREVNKKIEEEYLKILAPVFGVDFDDLKQRRKEQKLQKIRRLGTIFTVCLLGIGIYAASATVKMDRQRATIEEQYEKLRYNQAISLAKQSKQAYNEDRREEAMEIAYQALTEYSGVPMPYTDEARQALFQTLHLYGFGWSNKEQNQITLEGMVINTWYYEEEGLVLVYDDSKTLTCWNIENNQVLYQIKNIPYTAYYDPDGILVTGTAALSGNGLFAYVDSGTVHILKAKDGREIYTWECGGEMVYTYGNSVYILANGKLYDIDTGHFDHEKKMYKVGMLKGGNKICFINENYFVYTISDAEGNPNVAIYNLQKEKFLGGFKVADTKDIYIRDVCFDGRYMYVLINRFKDYGQTSIFHKSMVLKLDMNQKNCDIIWQKNYDHKAMNLFLAKDEEGNDIIAHVCDSVISLIEPKTGDIFHTYDMDGSLVYCFLDDEAITAYYNDGRSSGVYLSTTNPRGYIFNLYLEYRANEIIPGQLTFLNPGVLVIPNHDNRVIEYMPVYGQDIERTDEEGIPVKTKRYNGNAAQKQADKMGILHYRQVEYILRTDDDRYCIVSFANGKRAVYDYVTNKEVSNFTGDEDFPIKFMLGTDPEGNYYVRGENYGYLISKSGNMIGAIAYLEGYNKEENKVIIHFHSDMRFKAPAYSLEELLKKAEEEMGLR